MKYILFIVGCLFYSCNNCEQIKKYYDTGVLEFDYQKCNGKRNGLYKSYFPNGQLEQEANWVDGKAHGIMKGYYENGQLGTEQNYVDGHRQGNYILYDSLGRIEKKGICNMDKFTGLEYGYNDNNISATIKYFNGEIDYFGDYKTSPATFWKRQFFSEDYWINAKYDTLTKGISNTEFKFAVNHTIADSIRLKNENQVIFKWPEDNSTSFLINLPKYKDKNFEAVFYFRSDLGNKEHAGKTVEYPFTLPIN